MSGRLRLKPWLHDWLTLWSVEYIVVLHGGRADFVRLSGRNWPTVVFHVERQVTQETTATLFFHRLKESPAYYGQPFTVLVNNSRTFAYVKGMKGIDPTGLKQRLQLLTGERHDFKWSMSSIGEEECLVGQGIDREYLTCLTQCIETTRLPVSGVGALCVQTATAVASSPLGSPKVQLRHWPDGSADWVLFDGRSCFTFGRLGRNRDEEVTAGLKQVLTAYLGDAANKVQVCHSGCRQASSVPVRKERWSRQSGSAWQPSLVPYRFRSSGSAGRLQRSLNVGRLVTAVIGSIVLVAATVALALRIGAGNTTDHVYRYQRISSQKRELESTIVELQSKLVQFTRSQPAETHSAALVSLLCQRRMSGAYLTRVAVRHWGTDSTTVDARGVARSESQIFDYIAAVNEPLSPGGFAIGAINPDVVASAGKLDTVQTFRLSLVMNGQPAEK